MLMVVVFVLLGFVIGTCLGCSAVVVALSGARNTAYWSFVQRHGIVERLARLSIVALVVACGVCFAYLGYSLV
jgi:hypothetical protein